MPIEFHTWNTPNGRKISVALEEMGLAEAQPYRGAVVKGFTHTELLELYSTRRLLEIEAARARTEAELGTVDVFASAQSSWLTGLTPDVAGGRTIL